jgi:peptidoglycan/LPS O-acetylase OafA/YrhL
MWYLSSLAPGFRGDAPKVEWRQLLLHFGYLNGIAGSDWLNPVYWTLAIECQFYLLLALVFPLLAHRASGGFATIAVAGCAAMFLDPPNVFVFRHVGLFLLGIAAFRHRSGLMAGYELAGFLSAITACIVLTQGPEIAVAGLLTAVVIVHVDSPMPQWLSFVGSFSYSIYLLHVPIGTRIVHLGDRFAHAELEKLCVALAAVAMTLVASYVFYRCVERPSQRWASALRFRSSPAKADVPATTALSLPFDSGARKTSKGMRLEGIADE